KLSVGLTPSPLRKRSPALRHSWVSELRAAMMRTTQSAKQDRSQTMATLPSRSPRRPDPTEQQRQAIKRQHEAELLQQVRDEAWERFQRAERLRGRLEEPASPPSLEQQQHPPEKE